ncbi:hypothetical protein ACIQVR_32375 [Streptomyces xanthochromogenes]|uniref:hypothetical protein n=1 Tax=Streptomyces xanthochromogenes TaxID=67384 RepID=UPI0037F62EF7
MRHQTRARSVCILPLRSAVVNWLPEQPASELLAALRVSPAEVCERPAIRHVVTELGQRHRRTTGVRERHGGRRPRLTTTPLSTQVNLD